MKITCPHCNKKFDEADAILQPRKGEYKWYEFSGPVSTCPICNNQYALDISIKGLFFVFTVFPIIFFCINSNYHLAAAIIASFTILIANKFKQNFVVVKNLKPSDAQ